MDILNRVRVYRTVEECYKELGLELVNNPDAVDGGRGTHNYRLFSHDWTIVVTEPRSTLNLASVMFQPSRWYQRFFREYLEFNSFSSFLQLLRTRKGNEAQEYGYQAQGGARHSLGKCLLGITVRPGKNAPRISLFSRSVYLQPTGLLDLSLGACLCDYVASLTGVRPTLVWHISHLQTNCWKLLPWMLNEGIKRHELTGTHPQQIKYLDRLDAGLEKIITGIDPNPKYMFYKRQTVKVNAIFARLAKEEELPLYIPTIPDAYILGNPDLLSNLPDDDDDDDEGGDDD